MKHNLDPIKIVIIGPESTGKSTLCASLAAHFSTIWCKEYAREYLLKHGTDYSYDDLLVIARGQLKLEDEAVHSLAEAHSSLLFIDTDMYVMKVWCEFVF
jgi:nicotinamide riboside kinase